MRLVCRFYDLSERPASDAPAELLVVVVVVLPLVVTGWDSVCTRLVAEFKLWFRSVAILKLP